MLVTEDADVEAVLAVDRSVERSKLPSNRNSIPAAQSRAEVSEGKTHAEESSEADGILAHRRPSQAAEDVELLGEKAKGARPSEWLAEAQDAAAKTWAIDAVSDRVGPGRISDSKEKSFKSSGTARTKGKQKAGSLQEEEEIQGDWGKYVAEKRRMLRERGSVSGDVGTSGKSVVRVGGGIRLPAGGAPAGSRLGAMVVDIEYYEQLAKEED
jgi:hypothetical protein